MGQHAILKGGLTLAATAFLAMPVAGEEYKARLSGFQEIGALASPTGAILTKGTGTLGLDVDRNSATYSLTYSGLGSNVTQAHLHFGQRHVAGGIYAFLCTNLTPPAGVPSPPPCPAAGGTVSGTITKANIIGVASQNIPAGNFDVLLAAVDSNTTYVNVHTVQFPAGEIRGQVQHGNDEGEH